MIEVKRKERESVESLLRRFTRRVQQSGVLIEARKSQFRRPKKSKLRVRQEAIKRNEIKAEKEKLRKLGKLEDDMFNQSRRRK